MFGKKPEKQLKMPQKEYYVSKIDKDMDTLCYKITFQSLVNSDYETVNISWEYVEEVGHGIIAEAIAKIFPKYFPDCKLVWIKQSTKHIDNYDYGKKVAEALSELKAIKSSPWLASDYKFSWHTEQAEYPTASGTPKLKFDFPKDVIKL